MYAYILSRYVFLHLTYKHKSGVRGYRIQDVNANQKHEKTLRTRHNAVINKQHNYDVTNNDDNVTKQRTPIGCISSCYYDICKHMALSYTYIHGIASWVHTGALNREL